MPTNIILAPKFKKEKKKEKHIVPIISQHLHFVHISLWQLKATTDRILVVVAVGQ